MIFLRATKTTLQRRRPTADGGGAHSALSIAPPSDTDPRGQRRHLQLGPGHEAGGEVGNEEGPLVAGDRHDP